MGGQPRPAGDPGALHAPPAWLKGWSLPAYYAFPFPCFCFLESLPKRVTCRLHVLSDAASQGGKARGSISPKGQGTMWGLQGSSICDLLVGTL